MDGLAYEDLVVTSTLVLKNFRQTKLAYATGRVDDPSAAPYFERTDTLSSDRHRAVPPQCG